MAQDAKHEMHRGHSTHGRLFPQRSTEEEMHFGQGVFIRGRRDRRMLRANLVCTQWPTGTRKKLGCLGAHVKLLAWQLDKSDSPTMLHEGGSILASGF